MVSEFCRGGFWRPRMVFECRYCRQTDFLRPTFNRVGLGCRNAGVAPSFQGTNRGDALCGVFPGTKNAVAVAQVVTLPKIHGLVLLGGHDGKNFLNDVWTIERPTQALEWEQLGHARWSPRCPPP